MNHKPGGRLSLLSARPAVTPATYKRAATNFAAWQGRIKHLVGPTHFTMPGALRTSVSCLPVNAALLLGEQRHDECKQFA